MYGGSVGPSFGPGQIFSNLVGADPTVYIDPAAGYSGTKDIRMSGADLCVDGQANVGSSLVVTQGPIIISEHADFAAASANSVRVYARDSGGKTQLVARFPTGAIQVLATEP